MAKKANTSAVSSKDSAIVFVKALLTGSKTNKLGAVLEPVRRHVTQSGKIATKVQLAPLTNLFNKMRDTHNAFAGSQLSTPQFIAEYVLARDISASCEFMRDSDGRVIKADDGARNKQWGQLQSNLRRFIYEVSNIELSKTDLFTKAQVTDILKTAGKYYVTTVQAEARKMPRAVKVVKAEPKAMAASA
jgi:hypothetical protein